MGLGGRLTAALTAGTIRGWPFSCRDGSRTRRGCFQRNGWAVLEEGDWSSCCGPGPIPSAQRLVWAAKQPLGKAALGALFA